MNFKHLLNVVKMTLQDELHNKSFYILGIICLLFVFMIRGCFSGSMVMNGQQISGVTAGYYVSIFAFNFIAAAGALMAVLMAMRLLKRDRENGMVITILSKPYKRLEYIMGKSIGVSILSYSLVFILHLAIYFIMINKTGGRIPYFIPASLLIGLNILFAVSLVMVLSTFLPDVIAVLSVVAVAIVSLFSDSYYSLTQQEMVKNMIEQGSIQLPQVAWWGVLWPKIMALQYFATSLIRESSFSILGPVHPAINVAIYAILFFVLLYWRFSKEELQ
jgi:ABC-type transport system involved in multi-copper enzyme maturation permease subunit